MHIQKINSNKLNSGDNSGNIKHTFSDKGKAARYYYKTYQKIHLALICCLMIMISAIFLPSCNENSPGKTNTGVSKVNHPEWSKNANIYEVNIRQYTPEGTFKAFEEHLPRLKNMEVDILWLMPIHPIGEKNRKGTLGSYYSVKDYYGVNPEFGTMEDLISLVNKAHSMGMYVILDWVANHTAWDNKMIGEHPEWYTKDSAGNFISPFDWTDVVDLNYDNPELRHYMKDALTFWIEEADIDGYRCDVAAMVPIDFWNNVRSSLDSIKPVFMLAESEEPEHHKKAFDMTYTWEMHHLMNEIAKGNSNANELYEYFLKNDSVFPEDSYRMHFTSNHDENSWNGTVYERMGDAAKTFAVLTYIVPGMPLIYSGQEAGMNKRLEFFEKDSIPWNNYKLQSFYTKLNKLKKQNPALWNGLKGGDWKRIETTNDKSVFAIYRQKDKNKVLGIFNLSDKPRNIQLNTESISGSYNDYFSDEDYELGESVELSLSPWKYLIFSAK